MTNNKRELANTISLSQLQRIESVCARFEQAWSHADRSNIEAFLDGFEGPERAALLRELLALDLELRGGQGETPRATDYRALDQTVVRQVIDKASREEASSAPESPESSAPSIGSKISAYTLVSHLGEGGMGTVYLAEQHEPISRQVALKLVRSELASAKIIERFQRERQALAAMDHPNIAKVLDAGTSESGAPFFVMELVDGLPITRHCDAKKLGIKDRLRLFMEVCHAVQHAHQKGIIHRDLKPSNVMVTHYDDKPVPKVIDFGLATAVRDDSVDDPSRTEVGTVMGTLQYMAPEQADFGHADVDTRADVYSLGVILFELLTGETPRQLELLRNVSTLERLQQVRDSEPRPPSRLIRKATFDRTTPPERRDANRWQRSIRGELDWITLKALANDREDRYQSASAIAEDVQRFLADEPVWAGPPSTRYRVAKFVRRHRVPVAAAAAVFLSLLAGLVLATVGFVKARRERDVATTAQKEAERFLHLTLRAIDEMLSEVGEDSLEHVPQMESVRKALLGKALALHRELLTSHPSHPDLQLELAQAQRRMAHIYELLGEHEDSQEAYRESIRLFERLQRLPTVRFEAEYNLAVSHNKLGELKRLAGEREAEQNYTTALNVLDQLLDRRPTDLQSRCELALTQNNYGLYLLESGAYEQAESQLMEAIANQDKVTKARDDAGDVADLGRFRLNLGVVLRAQASRVAECERAYRAAIDDLEEAVGRDPSNQHYRAWLASASLDLGNLLQTAPVDQVEGSRDDAVEYSRNANQIFRNLTESFPLIPKHRYELANSHNSLANALIKTGDFESAKDHLKQANQTLDDLAESFPDFGQSVADCPSLKGIVLGCLAAFSLELDKKPEAARPYLEEAIKHQRKATLLSPENPVFANLLAGHQKYLATVLRKLGENDRAEELEREADPPTP